MMFQPCPACGLDDSVHDDGPFKETCTCEECGAQFKIEPDADFDGEDYKDCSTVGERIDQ
jgi:hypothetical protein